MEIADEFGIITVVEYCIARKLVLINIVYSNTNKLSQSHSKFLMNREPQIFSLQWVNVNVQFVNYSNLLIIADEYCISRKLVLTNNIYSNTNKLSQSHSKFLMHQESHIFSLQTLNVNVLLNCNVQNHSFKLLFFKWKTFPRKLLHPWKKYLLDIGGTFRVHCNAERMARGLKNVHRFLRPFLLLTDVA